MIVMNRFTNSILKFVIALLIGSAISSCGQSPRPKVTSADTSILETPNVPTAFSAEGTIKATIPGKDGYMATLTAADGKTYIITMSRLHLKEAYKELNVGDQLKVSGDTVHLNEQINILVKQYEMKK